MSEICRTLIFTALRAAVFHGLLPLWLAWLQRKE